MPNIKLCTVFATLENTLSYIQQYFMLLVESSDDFCNKTTVYI